MIRRTERHPLYGDIPLIEKRSTGSDGREYSWVEYDPTFMPPLPAGAVLIALARATVTYREMTGEGNLERAIGACRKARDEWPLSHEAFFWEAKCHKLAGRSEEAQQLFGDFIAAAGTDDRSSKLVVEASAELKELLSHHT